MVRAALHTSTNSHIGYIASTIYGVIGTVYGQFMFFHTVDATYRLRVIEEHEPDPETGEVASWTAYAVGDIEIVYIEIADVKYEVLGRTERRL